MALFSARLKLLGVDETLDLGSFEAQDEHEGSKIAEGKLVRYLLENEHSVDERLELRGLDGNPRRVWTRVWSTPPDPGRDRPNGDRARPGDTP